MNTVLLWVSRALVWTLLGPWYVILLLLSFRLVYKLVMVLLILSPIRLFYRMKFVDIYYVHPRYRTTEEILADPTVKDTQLEKVLTSESVRNMGTSARLASEEALKVCIYI